MDKILTVVIPTYNMEGYLDKCLTSLIVPDLMNDIEVLIINDGSKDSSLQIARKYEAKYPQTFIAVDKPNGNYGSCINKGLELATGNYFKVLDADDTFDNENFRAFLLFLKQIEVDLIISDFMIVNQNNGTKEHIKYNLPDGISFDFDFFAKKDVPYMWMHAITHLTEKMRRIGYQQLEGISYTDKELVFYPVAVSEKVAYFPKAVYQYLMGREGQTIDSTVWIKNYWMEEKAIKKLLDIYVEHRDGIGDGGQLFMKLQAKLYIRSIYDTYLQKSRGALPIDNLKTFDKWLEEKDPELYQCVDDERGIANYLYIHEWRRNMNNLCLYLINRSLHRLAFYLKLHR